jgi:hypothetical protein
MALINTRIFHSKDLTYWNFWSDNIPSGNPARISFNWVTRCLRATLDIKSYVRIFPSWMDNRKVSINLEPICTYIKSFKRFFGSQFYILNLFFVCVWHKKAFLKFEFSLFFIRRRKSKINKIFDHMYWI